MTFFKKDRAHDKVRRNDQFLLLSENKKRPCAQRNDIVWYVCDSNTEQEKDMSKEKKDVSQACYLVLYRYIGATDRAGQGPAIRTSAVAPPGKDYR